MTGWKLEAESDGTLNIKVGYGLAIDSNGFLKVTLTGGGSDTTSGGGDDTTTGGGDTQQGGGTDTVDTGGITFISDNLYRYIPCDSLPLTCTRGTITNAPLDYVSTTENNYATFFPTGSTPLYGIGYTANTGAVARLRLNFAQLGIPYTEDCWFYFPESAIVAAKKTTAGISILPNVTLMPKGKLKLALINQSGTTKNAVFLPSGDGDATAYANKAHHVAVTCVKSNERYFSQLALDGKFLFNCDYAASALANTANSAICRIFFADKEFYFTEHSAFNKFRMFNAVIWENNFPVPSADQYMLLA